MSKYNSNRLITRGFTIVELLIVIVVIAILAAVSVAAYTATQQRSRDAVRIQHMKDIVKALELYKHRTGTIPPPVYSSGQSMSGYESSSLEAPGEFIGVLSGTEFPNGTPIDPVNNATGATPTVARNNGTYGYMYYRYPAGSYGCDASLGYIYILGITRSEVEGATFSSSPGFSCPTRNWSTEMAWVTGGFAN